MSDPNPYQSPPSIAPAPAEPQAPLSADGEWPGLESQIRPLLQQGANGANWFYWIAGFSLVNSLIFVAGGNIIFVVGMAVTGIPDRVAVAIAQQNPDAAVIAKGAAFGWSVIISLLAVGVGKLASKRYLIVYAIGMFLYLLDGLLFLLLGELMCVAFHAYALYSLWNGFRAFRQLQTLENNLVMSPGFTMNVGQHPPLT